ncbi:MAG: VanZ family protein [Lachnospiraceae bacterium]|nr:VanZ family protein [Lachnospiraceae bacterium]
MAVKSAAKARRRRFRRAVCWLLFLTYMAGLLYFVFMSDYFGRSGQLGDEYRYNLTMFQEIHRFWYYRETVGFTWAAINLFGNVLCFMPFGFLVPVLRKHRVNVFLMTFYTFCFSLTIETLQLVLKIGVFDVDDLLLNTVGGAAGYILYVIVRTLVRAFERRRAR